MALVVGTNSYISRADAVTYFTDLIHGADFLDATDDIKDQALISATAMLDRQCWVGERTGGATQDLKWPRTGVSTPEGYPVDSATIPDFMEDATCELALSLIQDDSVQTDTSIGSNTKKLKAGSAEIEYFKGTTNSSTRFPTIVHEIIWPYLENSSAATPPYAGGADAESGLNDFDLSRGY